MIERRANTPENIERRSALDIAIARVAEWRTVNTYSGAAVPNVLLPDFQLLVDTSVAWRDDGLTTIALALIAAGRISKAHRSYSGKRPVRINYIPTNAYAGDVR